MSKGLLTALFIVVFILGIGTGYYLTPNYLLEENEMNSNFGTPEQKDFQYLKDMASHHKEAIALANQVLNQTRNEKIKDIANMIITEEPKSIDKLETELSSRFNLKGSTDSSKVVNLGSYDQNLDLRFLNALEQHHNEGIIMAKNIQYTSTNNFVLTDAQTVQTFLESSTETIRDLREEIYKLEN